MPDYVFAPDYRLPPLAEVEAYVSEHRHLPGVPAEAELRAEGLDLAEMNLRLLEKVEELTLYTIAQEKRLRKLEAELNAAKAAPTENRE